MTKRQKNFIGRRFGRLVITAELPSDKPRKLYLVQCDCGTLKKIYGTIQNKSCGCGIRDAAKRTHTKHGQGTNKTPEYCAWQAAKARRHNPGHQSFHGYGARGIIMCETWRASFETFYADMGPRPVDTTLDRRDNDGNYEPGNCRWATRKEQQCNRRTNFVITGFGETMTLSQMADKYGVRRSSLTYRIKRGEAVEAAIVRYRPDLRSA